MATQFGPEEMTGLQKCHMCKQRKAIHKAPGGTICILLDVRAMGANQRMPSSDVDKGKSSWFIGEMQMCY